MDKEFESLMSSIKRMSDDILSIEDKIDNMCEESSEIGMEISRCVNIVSEKTEIMKKLKKQLLGYILNLTKKL